MDHFSYELKRLQQSLQYTLSLLEGVQAHYRSMKGEPIMHPDLVDLLAYPKEFPQESMTKLGFDAIMNKTFDVKFGGHVGWHVLGWGLSKWDTHEDGMMAVKAATPMGKDEAKAMTEALCSDGMKAFDWEKIASYLRYIVPFLLPFLFDEKE